MQSNFSLSAYVKYKVKNVVQFISDYEESIVSTLKDRELDGVICGHIHHAEIKDMNGFLYINTGDFVESCTAIVEHFNGDLELVTWQQKDLPLITKENPDVDITTT
jgi:UDP-2,3-diacylglucosamine pyrophosphatase LpxH